MTEKTPENSPEAKGSKSRSRKDPFGEGVAAARARRMRSWAIAVLLVFFVGLVFAISVLRLSGHGVSA
jgi:hypothetical protein